MIHPSTELRFISEEVGYGVFATQFIPKGSITYVKDCLEISVSPGDYEQLAAEMQEAVEKYSYIDERGHRIVSWDFGKYVNHCCQCNTISTGYGFELAIRDIQPGEQITDEYGIFNLQYYMDLRCGEAGCRCRIGPDDFDRYYSAWDEKIKSALPLLRAVDQPLLSFVDAPTATALDRYFSNPSEYRSVYALKYHPAKVSNGVVSSRETQPHH
jgi:hypothetical protein